MQLAFEEIQLRFHRRLPPVEPHFEKLHRQCDPDENIGLLECADQVRRFGKLLLESTFQLAPNKSRVVPFHGIINDGVRHEYFHQPKSQRRTDHDQQKKQYELRILLAIEIPRDDHIGDQIEIADVDRHEQGHNADCEPVVGHTRTVNDRQDRQHGEPEDGMQENSLMFKVIQDRENRAHGNKDNDLGGQYRL